MRKITIIFLLLIASRLHAQRREIDSLKKAITTTKDDTTKVNLICELCWRYAWSYPDSAIMLGQQALQLSQKANYLKGIAKSQNRICAAYTTLGNFPQAMSYGFKSLAISKQNTDIYKVIDANTVIGMCYREQGDYKTALIYFHNAEIFSRKLNLGKSYYSYMAGFWGMLSSIYEKNNQLDSALFYAKKSYQYNTHWSGLMYVIADIYAKKGEHNLAMQFFKKTIMLSGLNNAQIDIVDVYNGIAHMYLAEGKTDSAIFYGKKAIAQKWGKVYPKGVLEASAMLSNIYQKQSMPDSALKYLKFTLTLKDSLFSRQKEREIQGIAFNDQLQQQELEQQRNRAQTRLILFSLTGGMFTLLVIGFMLWRNNRQKQKINLLLNEQKEEISAQRDSLEDTLGKLRATQSQLIQREKMASLGELTAGIAHEIQNPLNFVNNFSEVNTELIEEMEEEIGKGNLDEVKAIAIDIKGNQKKISQHGRRADFIVKGMLEHSHNNTDEKQLTNINVLANEFFKLSYHGLRAKDKSFNAEMVTHFDHDLPKVNVVQQDMGRVLLNLVNNAFYAVNKKAKTAGTDYKPTVELSTTTKNGSVEIHIKDNGTGIPDSVKEKIMQPFFTTKPTGEGTGLGLSLCYDIVVKGHGGSISVDTKEGEYTEFTITLPLN